MEKQGCWNLFWATGLPEAWLWTREGPEKTENGEEVLYPPQPLPYPMPREI